MSSTFSVCTCAQCGNPEAWIETYYRRGVFHVECLRCGYREWTSNLVDKSKTTAQALYFKHNRAGRPIRRHYTRTGYGVVMLNNEAGGIFQSLNKPVTAAKIQAIFKQIQRVPNLDLHLSYFVLWHPETASFQVLFGTFPPLSEAEEESGDWMEVGDDLESFLLGGEEIPF